MAPQLFENHQLFRVGNNNTILVPAPILKNLWLAERRYSKLTFHQFAARYNCPWTMRQLGRAGAWAFKAAQVAVPSFRRKHNARFFWVKLVAFEKLK